MSFAKPQFKNRYQNFIGGEWVDPIDGEYFTNISPVDGQACCEIPRSDKKDVDRAVEAAWQAAKTWTKTAAAVRSALLHKIADRLEANLERLAVAEAWDNGKAVRETLNADLPLAIDHFRYFGSVIRGEAGDVCDLDAETVSMEVHEPLGVVGQIIPWNFPILMAAWKLAPALAAGNCVVIKAASQTPVGILLDDGADRRHPAAGDRQRGQRVRRGGRQTAGDAPRDQEGGLHGRNDHGPSHHAIRVGEHHSGDARAGRQIAERLLGERHGGGRRFPGQSRGRPRPVRLQPGRSLHLSLRALVHERIYDRFMDRCVQRVEAIKMGDPLDPATMMARRPPTINTRRFSTTLTSASKRARKC